MADFDESDIPKEVPVSEETEKDPENVIRGHKAALSNPNVSEKAKAHSRQVLDSYEEPYGSPSASQKTTSTSQEQNNPQNVSKGLKASTHNPEMAKKVLAKSQDHKGESIE
ncbi:hypothetical protein OQA88_744 [Cercophora sp. LCS_1]